MFEDDRRRLVASPFLKLELIPKARYLKRTPEIVFYETLFDLVSQWVPSSDRLVESAIALASKYDVVGLDAIHIAAAIDADVAQLITLERGQKPIHRVSEIQVVELAGI